MIDLVQEHEAAYRFLTDFRKSHPKTYFTFRKSNHAGRLEDGYWFYGNDDYLAISFWSGMDWKNRTPNIIFIYNKQGEAFLEINVSDSVKKLRLIEDEFVPLIDGLERKGRKFMKRLPIQTVILPKNWTVG